VCSEFSNIKCKQYHRPVHAPLFEHTTDMTATFLHDSVRRFAEDVDLFIQEKDLSLNIVDKASGY
jgi:hypothetical protein